MKQEKLQQFKEKVLNRINRFFQYKNLSNKSKMGLKFKQYLDCINTGIYYNFYTKQFYKDVIYDNKTKRFVYSAKNKCTINDVVDILAPISYQKKYCHSKQSHSITTKYRNKCKQLREHKQQYDELLHDKGVIRPSAYISLCKENNKLQEKINNQQILIDSYLKRIDKLEFENQSLQIMNTLTTIKSNNLY